MNSVTLKIEASAIGAGASVLSCGFFCFLLFSGIEAPEQIPGQEGSRCAKQDATQNIRRVVDIKIKPGECHESGKDAGNDPCLFVIKQQTYRYRCGAEGVAGREGKVPQPGHQKLCKTVGVMRADPTD